MHRKPEQMPFPLDRSTRSIFWSYYFKNIVLTVILQLCARIFIHMHSQAMCVCNLEPKIWPAAYSM